MLKKKWTVCICVFLINLKYVVGLLCFHCQDQRCKYPRKVLCGAEEQYLLSNVFEDVNFNKTGQMEWQCIKVLYTTFLPSRLMQSDIIRILGCDIKGRNSFCDPDVNTKEGVILYHCEACKSNYCNTASKYVDKNALLIVLCLLYCIFS